MRQNTVFGDMIAIDAHQYVEPSRDVVESAELVADNVVSALDASNDVVVVSLRGLRGVPSSFFNVILGRIRASFGVDAIRTRFRVTDASDLQLRVYQRSFEAFLRADTAVGDSCQDGDQSSVQTTDQ